MITKFRRLTVLIAMGLLATPLCAQQKEPIVMSSEGMKSSYIQQHAIDVDDIPGHQIRPPDPGAGDASRVPVR